MNDLTPTWVAWRDTAKLLDVGGPRVAVYERGDRDGQVVTYLHGYPSSSFDLVPVLPHLGDGVRVIAVDLPGFGAADKPKDHDYTIHAAADAVEGVWAHLDVTTGVVAAHDYSVSVAQELLARRSSPVAAVVFMNGGLYPDLHRPTRGQTALLDPDHGAEIAASVSMESFVGGTAATWGQRVPFDEGAVVEMFNSMDEQGGVAMMHTLLHYVADRRAHAERWSSAIADATVPLTFVWGDIDPVSGAHMIERVETVRPDARIVRLADVGHWPPLEAPDVVAAEITRLLD